MTVYVGGQTLEDAREACLAAAHRHRGHYGGTVDPCRFDAAQGRYTMRVTTDAYGTSETIVSDAYGWQHERMVDKRREAAGALDRDPVVW